MEEVPFQDRTVPRTEIDWDRSAWWWYPLTRAIHPAMRATSLMFSLLAVLLLRLGLRLADDWFSPGFDWSSAWGWSHIAGANWPTPMLLSAFPSLSLNHLAFVSFVLLWTALVSALFGGVLVRRAAIELGQRTMASWIHSGQLCLTRLSSYLWAAGMYVAAIAVLLIPVLLLGWISRFGPLPATVSGVVLLILSIPLMFACGRMLISLLVCYPLSVCAISIEKKADAFEGFSRSNAYVFQCPVVAALCVALLALLGELGALLVQWTVQAGWAMVSEAYAATGGHNEHSVRYLSAGSWLATSLIMAYRFSFFWSAAAALYLVLRRCVDNTPLEEIETFESELLRQPPLIPTTSQPSTVSSDQPSSKDS